MSQIQKELTPGTTFSAHDLVLTVKPSPTGQPDRTCMARKARRSCEHRLCPFYSVRYFWTPRLQQDQSIRDGCQIAVALAGEQGAMTPHNKQGVGTEAARAVAEFQFAAHQATGKFVSCTVFDFSPAEG